MFILTAQFWNDLDDMGWRVMQLPKEVFFPIIFKVG